MTDRPKDPKEDAARRRRGAGHAPAAAPDPAAPHGELGRYMTLNGDRIPLEHHPQDFTVLLPPDAPPPDDAVSLAPGLVRVSAPGEVDEKMAEVRTRAVAHHVYRIAGTGEEIVIENRVVVRLKQEDPDELEAIAREHALVPEGRMGRAYVLRVTEASGRNPVKVANAIARRPGVEEASPVVMQPLRHHQEPLTESQRLFAEQWYLGSELSPHADLQPTAGIRAAEAWQITTGSPDVVIAVIDDGFDLDHPAFTGKRIHPAARNFGNGPAADPSAREGDYHGTCVASIATGTLEGGGMVGVAPTCTFLPIRINLGYASIMQMLEVFRYVSRYADVVNCSFGYPPTSFDLLSDDFRQALAEMARTGGRRGKGLVIVFAAGNDDAPTRLRAAENRHGVAFVQWDYRGEASISTIPPERDVFSGYPLTPGVLVVGAMSSLKRKSGYSNWGPHITVCAPSNNLHYIPRFVRPGVQDDLRARFLANYRGLGQVAAVNRPGKGDAYDPSPDDPATTDFAEQNFTRTFGGTSGAAPVVSGVAALMISANPYLSAGQVIQILKATADTGLDPKTDLQGDPNHQEFTGRFQGGRSLFFGAGKVDAYRAVKRARALLGSDLFSAGPPPQDSSASPWKAPLPAPPTPAGTITVKITGAPYKGVKIDDRELGFDGDIAQTAVAPGQHRLDWLVQGTPGTEFVVSLEGVEPAQPMPTKQPRRIGTTWWETGTMLFTA